MVRRSRSSPIPMNRGDRSAMCSGLLGSYVLRAGGDATGARKPSQKDRNSSSKPRLSPEGNARMRWKLLELTKSLHDQVPRDEVGEDGVEPSRSNNESGAAIVVVGKGGGAPSDRTKAGFTGEKDGARVVRCNRCNDRYRSSFG
jgi:hypothetical protein